MPVAALFCHKDTQTGSDASGPDASFTDMHAPSLFICDNGFT